MIQAIVLQLLLLILFLIVTVVIFVGPGLLFLQKFRFKSSGKLSLLVVAATLGFCLFTVIAYILAALHLRFLMWLFVPVGFYGLYYSRKLFTDKKIAVTRKVLVPFLLVLLIGSIGMVAVNAFSGWKRAEGIVFYSSHGHDGVWHLALIEHLKRGEFPFQNPEYAGHRLQNYHFFVDLLMSELSRLFGFSGLDIYFRFLPTFFALLFGFAAFVFVREWTKKEWAGIWAMVFVYFCGSFGYLISIPRNGNLIGESMFWVSQTQSVLGNPPHASAFIIVTVFFYLLYRYLKERSKLLFFLCAFLGGVVIEFKVYGGVLILGGLLVIGLWELIKGIINSRKLLIKKNSNILLLFFTTLAIALIIYLPNSQNSQDFIMWQPWYFIRTMVVAGDRLNWLDMELRRQTYIYENNWKRVVQLEVTAFLIFLFGNLGMRFLGFWTILKQLRSNIFKDSFNLFFLSITVASFIVPVFFVQKGVVWNAIQFNQYFLLFFGYLAAVATNDLISRLKLSYGRWLLSALVIILAVPTQIGLLYLFYSGKPLSIISNNELQALDYLKTVSGKDDVILTYPFNKYETAKYSHPFPIYSWYDTGYVAAFTGRETLISDEEQVNIMGYDAKELLENRKQAFESEEAETPVNFLNNIDAEYIYLVYGQKFTVDEGLLPIEKLFENEHATVYRIKR